MMTAQEMGRSLVVVTGNTSKANEISTITGWSVEPVDLPIREVQSLDVEEVAREKARMAYEILGRPVVVDDTGMSINALQGLPGALVSWFLDTIGPGGILKFVGSSAERGATVSTCVAFADEHGVRTFVGSVRGSLSAQPRGSNGFGYDPIFIPEGEKRTYAEMSPEEKNASSMRRAALMKLRDFLNSPENSAAASA